MKFTYETQGAITYLVCELEPGEMLESLTLGMLTNNHITGVAPVVYTEMMGQRLLKYNISAKISANQFFGGNVTRARALQAFKCILDGLCAADDYMIDQNCFSVVPEHIFLNVSSCETALICIPVVNERDIHTETAELFKKILLSAQFDRSEDMSYVQQLLTYINGGGFNLYLFRDMVLQLQATPVNTISAAPKAPKLPDFNSTISIDDMLNPAKEPEPAPAVEKPVAPAVQPPVQIPAQPPVQAPVPPVQAPVPPVQPPVQAPVPPVQPPVPPVQAPKPPVVGAPPVQPPVQPQPPVAPGPFGQPPMGSGQQPPVAPGPFGQPPVAPGRPPVNTPPAKQPASSKGLTGAGFAVPGQPANRPPFAVPGQPPVGPGQQPPMAPPAPPAPAAPAGDKKIGFFGLMAHYNKENAAAYKAQKEAAKAEKASKKGKKAAPAPMPPVPGAPMPPVPGAPVPPVPGGPGQPFHPNAPMPGQPPVQQPYTVPQYQPAVQPVPVQSSFNETTVLSNFAGGETTVLNAQAAPTEPYLVRIKTGERIFLNKPVFRIGKEKSYVDYFISDNTAISRSHCNIHIENGTCYIEDTNSTNHTYVNDQIINSNVKVKLESGDKVKLANEDFIFSK